MEELSTTFMGMMTKDWEDAGEEPPTVPEEDPVPPKRSLSPRTERALREVVTCILRHVARKRRRQRDEQADVQDKLKCELAVLQWQRSGREVGSSQLGEDGPRPAPPAWPGKRTAGPVPVSGSVEEEEEEKRKLWDSLRKKYQQKTRAKVAPRKAWNAKQEQWEVQGPAFVAFPRAGKTPGEDEESPEHSLSLCPSQYSYVQR
ncbi:uncharacterized protein LOC130597729 [Pezoporus wallicus]|uniref:uncharacterized protein LOC130597729 n=1 Tax=Pezoporus wallicus TaxID=35540 RepID=UPI00255169C7|nr:uncharacterized protein LOC130597729 [Pezoporus wallicus]